jgi:hypothetical protein
VGTGSGGGTTEELDEEEELDEDVLDEDGLDWSYSSVADTVWVKPVIAKEETRSTRVRTASMLNVLIII